MGAVLQATALSRRFGTRQAVQALDLHLEPGTILGLLGPNGAGKTTCLQMLAGVLQPSRGSIQIQGLDLRRTPRQARRQLGYLPERVPLSPELRLDEALQYCGRLQGLRGSALRAAVAAVMAECALEAVAQRLLGRLSKGYRQRAGLAQALLHDPALLLLDEPGDGLDPLQNQALRALIRRRAERGCAVIFSSHRLDEVQNLCTAVLILRDGQVIHQAALQNRLGGDNQPGARMRVRLVPPTTPTALGALPLVAHVEACDDGRLRLQLQPDATPAQLSRLLVERGFGLAELSPEPDDLERRFLTSFGVCDSAH